MPKSSTYTLLTDQRAEQAQARAEIVKLHAIVKKQHRILVNIEGGVYSQTSKKIRFNDEQKP